MDILMLKPIKNNNALREKRNQDRIHPDYYLKVFNRKTGIGIGPLGNISSAGVMILSHELFLPGNVIDFAMILPSKINGKLSVGFKGECVWCREDHANEYHRAGFELTDLDEQSSSILSVLMHSFI